MVIKSKIYKFLKKNLGEYLYGFEKNQLDVGLLSGRIELVNVNFRPDKVNDLLANYGLPIHIKAGLIGKLKFKCNYLDMFSSPLDIEIDELLLVFGPISQIYKEQNLNEEADQDIQAWLDFKETEILNTAKGRPNSCVFNLPADFVKRREKKNGRKKSRKKRKEDESEEENSEIDPFVAFEKQKRRKLTYGDDSATDDPDKPGLVEQYLIKVLKNLILTVRSVHVSYEDESYPFEHPFSIGVSVDKVEYKNSSQEWVVSDNKVVKVRSSGKSGVKDVSFNNFSVYVYSMASMFIPTSLYEDTINSRIGIFEAFPAYEIRDLILQQSKALAKGGPNTFLEPVTVKCCVSFGEEYPNFKVVGFIDKISVNFTPAMAECLRNFWDYCKNVKIWPIISKYRPSQRIPPRPPKREHRKERRKRREIVREWFQYAYQFVKLKNAAIKYVKDREKEKKLIKRIEAQAKIREKIESKRQQKPEKKPSEPPSPIEQPSSFSSIFSMGRKKPSSNPTNLKNLIDNIYNKKPAQNTGKRPYDGEKYFPEYLNNSDLELNVGLFKARLIDEETGMVVEVMLSEFVEKISTLMDEMNVLVGVQELVVGFKGQNNKEVEVFRCVGNKGQKDGEQGVKTKLVYRPAEVLIPGDTYNTFNMYESVVEIGNFNCTYSHNLINQLFLIKESMTLNKAFRENVNIEFIKSLSKSTKKRKILKVFGSDLKKFADSKKLGLQLADFQQWIEEKIVEFNSTFLSILFSGEFKAFNGEINFHDFSPNTLMSVSVPQSLFSVGKTKEAAYLSAFGITMKSPTTPAGLYDFLTTLGNLLCENLKKMQKFTSYKRIN